MATAQALRAKAVAQGTLKDSKEQKITTEAQNNTTIIKIEPVNPASRLRADVQPDGRVRRMALPGVSAVLLVSPGYAYPYGGALLGFTAGAIIGGALWGNCNWGGGNVNINVNRYNNFNRSNISNGNWNHNANHRGAVPYRDKGVAQQYGRRQSADAASREAFRGRADSGRQSIQRAMYRRATSRDAIWAAAMQAGPAARQAVVTSAGATPAACAVRPRSTPAAARRRAISAIVDRRAWGRHALQATSAAAPAEAEAEAEAAAGGRGGGGRR